MTHMHTIEQNLAIHKALGLPVFFSRHNKSQEVPAESQEQADTLTPGQSTMKFCHDYCGDLNAMHEAENNLSDEDHFQFTMCLDALSFLKDPEKKRIIRPHSEPASQRAEAFLRTLNLWKDTTP